MLYVRRFTFQDLELGSICNALWLGFRTWNVNGVTSFFYINVQDIITLYSFEVIYHEFDLSLSIQSKPLPEFSLGIH